MVYHIDVLFFINILLEKLLLCVEKCFVSLGIGAGGKLFLLTLGVFMGICFCFLAETFSMWRLGMKRTEEERRERTLSLNNIVY